MVRNSKAVIDRPKRAAGQQGAQPDAEVFQAETGPIAPMYPWGLHRVSTSEIRASTPVIRWSVGIEALNDLRDELLATLDRA